MSATIRRIIVWGSATEEATDAPQVPPRRQSLLRRANRVDTLGKRYSELTGLAARLIDECRRLRSDNDDLRGSAEMWIRMYERQLERANTLEAELRKSR